MFFVRAAPLLAVAVVLLALASAGDHAAADQPRALWLPWEGGTLWTYTQGPHGPVAEAMDFQAPDQGGKPCEYFQSSFWVVAAADGTVSSSPPNSLEIDHGDGFSTVYYHLEAKQRQVGDQVRAGDRLGLPGCCPDGWGVEGCTVTGPHLHFYTMYRGQRQSAVGLNLGGWRVMPDGCLNRAGQAVCPLESGWGARIVSNSPRQGQTEPSTPSDLALIMDTSSGSAPESADLRREAALALLQATRPDDRVSVIDFNSSAHVVSPLRESVTNGAIDTNLVDAVQAPSEGGRTNIRLGLVTACAELLMDGKSPARAAILLSDGKHNVGSLAGAEACLVEHGIPVYTYGVGPSNKLLLQRIANNTGGEFRPLSEVDNLYCEFLRIRSIISGDPPGGCSTFQLKPGDSLSLPFEMPADQDQAILEIRWRERRTAEQAAAEGVPVNPTILAPSGQALEIPFPGITLEEEDGAVRYKIAYPQSGTWTLVVSANDRMPPEGLFITFSASTITQASPYLVLPPEPEPEVTESPPPTDAPAETPSDTPQPTDTERPTRTKVPEPTSGADTQTPVPTPLPTRTPVPPTEPPPESPSSSSTG